MTICCPPCSLATVRADRARPRTSSTPLPPSPATPMLTVTTRVPAMCMGLASAENATPARSGAATIGVLELTTRNWSPSIRATVAPGGTAWSSRSATSARMRSPSPRAQALVDPAEPVEVDDQQAPGGPGPRRPAERLQAAGARADPGQRVHQQFGPHSPGLGGRHLMHRDHQGVEPALASRPRPDHLDRAAAPRAHELDRTESLASAGGQLGERGQEGVHGSTVGGGDEVSEGGAGQRARPHQGGRGGVGHTDPPRWANDQLGQAGVAEHGMRPHDVSPRP